MHTTEATLNIRLIHDELKTDYVKRFILPLASSHLTPNTIESDLQKIHHIPETITDEVKLICRLYSFKQYKPVIQKSYN